MKMPFMNFERSALTAQVGASVLAGSAVCLLVISLIGGHWLSAVSSMMLLLTSGMVFHSVLLSRRIYAEITAIRGAVRKQLEDQKRAKTPKVVELKDVKLPFDLRRPQ